MGKASRAKKERREARLRGEATDQQQDYRILDNSPIVPHNVAIAYLVTKFVGKSGYKFISIGRNGSLFMNEKAMDIVAVNLHREFPITSVRGRFNDPQKRDISVNAFHVPEGFPGIVVDRNANVYIGGSSNVATKEEIESVLTDFRKVTAEEYNVALQAEQPIIEEQLKKMKEKFEQTEQEVKQNLEASIATPYDDNVATAIADAVEVLEPVVEEETSKTTPYGEIKDAEVIE